VDNFTWTRRKTSRCNGCGYDPARGGSGGPVFDFTIAFYGSTAGDTQRISLTAAGAIQVGGTLARRLPVVRGVMMYDYAFNCPRHSRLKLASSIGCISSPSIRLAGLGDNAGTGGDGLHFRRIHQDGDVYQIVSGDGTFTLLGGHQLAHPTSRTHLHQPDAHANEHADPGWQSRISCIGEKGSLIYFCQVMELVLFFRKEDTMISDEPF